MNAGEEGRHAGAPPVKPTRVVSLVADLADAPLQSAGRPVRGFNGANPILSQLRPSLGGGDPILWMRSRQKGWARVRQSRRRTDSQAETQATTEALRVAGDEGTSSAMSHDSHFRMFETAGRPETTRVALAEGMFVSTAEVITAIAERKLAKGDALALAEIAGVLAAKQVPSVIPLCHNVVLDSVRVYCAIEHDPPRVIVRAEAATTARTGVEIEAIAAVQAALLCIYDLTKSMCPSSSMTNVRLLEKRGGRNGHWTAQRGFAPTAKKSLAVALITVSDRSSAGLREDKSGPAMREFCGNHGWTVVGTAVVPDERERIQEAVLGFARGRDPVALVVLSGGTGIGPRDVTPEAVRPLFSCELPGFGELARSAGARETGSSWISRGSAGFVDETLVVMTPGSPRGAASTLETLRELIVHAVAMRASEPHAHESSGTHVLSESHGSAHAAREEEEGEAK